MKPLAALRLRATGCTVREGSPLLPWVTVRADEGMAVLAEPTLDTVVTITAALLAGVPAVPIPPDAGDLERDHILRDSGAELYAAGPAASGSVPAEPDPDAPALVLYTSGTTGPPKGAVLSRKALAADLDALAAVWQWTPDDTLVHGLPLFHVHGLVLGVLGALRVGSPLVHTRRPTPAGYARAATEHGGTLFFGVPTVWSRVAADPAAAAALRGTRLLVSGSAPLPAPVFDLLAARSGHRPVERYGMTETLITLAARAETEHLRGVVGGALPGVRTRLAASVEEEIEGDGGELVGELEVSGPTVFSGYLRRPDADAASFTADGWFRTGDLAALRPDGTHRIIGRTSTDLIKCGGYRIGAGEVEDALLGATGVREVAVVGVPDEDLGEAVTAFVVTDTIGQVTAQDLIEHVAGQLGAHKRPRAVRFVDELPRNPMGKVLKRELRP